MSKKDQKRNVNAKSKSGGFAGDVYESVRDKRLEIRR